MSQRTCTVDGCDTDARARGWCGRHYQRWDRTGDPEGSVPRGNRRDARRHGTRHGYNTGCRCFPCRIAQSRYDAIWQQHGGVRVSSETVAGHIRTLVASGWTKRDIAAEADIAATTPWHITSGRSKSVNSRTAAAILSLQPVPGPVVLDSRPLVAAIEAARLPIATVFGDTDRRSFYRARESGRITDAAADRLAIVALGLTLDEIYGPDWDSQEAAA